MQIPKDGKWYPAWHKIYGYMLVRWIEIERFLFTDKQVNKYIYHDCIRQITFSEDGSSFTRWMTEKGEWVEIDLEELNDK